MASHSVKELVDNSGNPLLVEVARRDEDGKLITNTYAKLTAQNTFTATNKFDSYIQFTRTSGSSGLKFGTKNYYITNMQAGTIKNINLDTGQYAQSAIQTITLQNASEGAGTWHVAASVSGQWAVSVNVCLENVTNTGFSAFLCRLRTMSSDTNKTFSIEWVAVKYY